MSSQKEHYIHFMSSLNDLNKAWRILQDIKRCADHPLVGPAFRFALIEYSKPYRCSHGKAERHKLGDEHIPVNYNELHNRILKARDQIHAHSDLTVKEATLYVTDTGHGNIVVTTQNAIFGTEELSNIDDIVALIEQTLSSMYEEIKRLESKLPTDLEIV